MRLVRLRADPKLVRISVRHEGDGFWLVSVEPRSGEAPPRFRSCHVEKIGETLGRLIEGLWRDGLNGFDPWCEGAYEHPWPRSKGGGDCAV